MAKVSVCVATFNGEKFIEKQLISILTQLNEIDEVIISDDNSTDDTLQVISRLVDKRIKLYVNEGRPGPVHNFEQALKKATGDYILLADQDDVWIMGKVEAMRSLLATYDLVLSDCQVVDEMDRIIHSSFFKHRGSKPGFWRNMYKNSYIGCCMAFRREVLLYALPFPSYIHMHDWWIGLLAEMKGKVLFYPHPMIRYVRHGKNASLIEGEEQRYSFSTRFKNRFVLLLNVAVRASTLLLKSILPIVCGLIAY